MRSIVFMGMATDEYGVVACGPLVMNPGSLPFAVCVRALDGTERAKNPNRPERFAVHDMTVGSKVSFSQGDYFSVEEDGVEAAFKKAVERWQHRLMSQLGVDGPLLNPVISILEKAEEHTVSDYTGEHNYKTVEVEPESYFELQKAVSSFTGKHYGISG